MVGDYRRPEERAASQQIEQSRLPNKVISGAVNAGTTAVGLFGGSALLTRVLPLLNKAVPADLAAKALSKIDPRLGKFLKGVFSSGFTIDEGLDYLRQNLGNESKKQEIPYNNDSSVNPNVQQLEEQAMQQENNYNKMQGQSQGQSQQQQQSPGNPIQQLAPELHSFLENEIFKGRPPLEAAGLAKVQGFDKAMSMIEKKVGQRFSDLVEKLYGGMGTSLQQPQGQQPQAQQQQPQQQQQGQSGNGIDPNLMQIMQNMQATMQKFRGK